MSIIRIQTTQNVVVEYETASAGSRILARFLDGLTQGIVVLVVGGLFALTGFNALALVAYASLILGWLLLLLYHPLCEIFFNGQTLGKRALDLRVVRLDGTRPRVGDFLLRWLVGLVEIDMTGGLVALVAILASQQGQRLGDMAGHTTVVSLKRRRTGAVAPPPEYLPDYEVQFPQVTRLTDHDVALLGRLLQEGQQRRNPQLLTEAATKVKTLTGIESELDDESFLQVILRDHAHLAHQGWER